MIARFPRSIAHAVFVTDEEEELGILVVGWVDILWYLDSLMCIE